MPVIACISSGTLALGIVEAGRAIFLSARRSSALDAFSFRPLLGFLPCFGPATFSRFLSPRAGFPLFLLARTLGSASFLLLSVGCLPWTIFSSGAFAFVAPLPAVPNTRVSPRLAAFLTTSLAGISFTIKAVGPCTFVLVQQLLLEMQPKDILQRFVRLFLVSVRAVLLVKGHDILELLGFLQLLSE